MVKRFKGLFIISVILFSAVAGFAVTKTWVGGDFSKPADWDTPENWSPSGVPGANDDVIIDSTGIGNPVIENTFSLSPVPKNVKIKNLTIKDNRTLEIILKDYNVTLECTGGISVEGKIKLTHKWTGGSGLLAGMTNIAGGNNSKIELQEAASGFSKYRTILITNINKVKHLSVKNQTDYFKLNNNLEISGVLTNNIAPPTPTFPDKGFNANGKAVTFNGVDSKIKGSQITTFADLKIESSKKVTLEQSIKIGRAFHNDGELDPGIHKVNFTGSACEVRGYSNSTFYDFEVESSASCKIHRDITIKNSFNNAGTFNAADTQKTVFLKPSGINLTITGTSNQADTKFHSIKCENAAGKTLKVEGKISVEGLVLSGTPSPVSYLRVDSGTSGEIHLKVNHTGTGAYLNINTDKVKIEPVWVSSSDWGYKVYNSQKNGTPVLPSGTVVNGWKFMSGGPPVTLYWIGKNDTGWETAGNWAEESGGGYRESSYIPTYNATVIIPAKQTILVSGTSYPVQYPVLAGNGNAKSIVVAENATLDLAGFVIKKGTGSNDFTPLTNNGTLKMTGTVETAGIKGQKEWFETGAISLSNNSTVEYYGNTPATSDIWAGPYKKLKVSGAKTGFTTEDLKVNEYFTVNTTGSFIINADSQSYTQMVTLNKSTTFSSTNAGGTVFESYLMTNGNTVGFSGNGKIETKDDVYGYGNITVNTGTGAWNSSGKIQANIINTQRNWTSLDNVTANGSITANDWTAKNVTLKGSLTAAQFNQTGGTLTFNGNGTLQTLSFTNPAGNIHNLTIDNGAKVKLGSEITIKGDFTNNGTLTADSGTTVTLTPSGSTVTITGTGTAANTKFHNLSLTGAGGKTLKIDGKITVNGDLKLEGTSDGSPLTVQGGTNPSEITLNGHKTGGKWLKVKNDIPITNGGSYMAVASKPEPVSTPPRNWIFTNAQGQIVWTGNVDTNWNTAGNWDPPYATPSEHADVIIKPGQGGKYPHVGQHTGAKAKSVTVENNAKLDLGEWTIKTSGGLTAQLDVESGGHLFLKGSTDQKAWFEQGTPANKMTVQAGSTVEYNGNPSVASNVWEGPYHELIVSGGKTSLAASGMTVNDTFTVNTNGTLTVTAPTQTYKNAVTLNGNTTFAASSSVTFEQNASITGSNSTFAVRGNLKLECASVNVKEISVSGTTEAAGTASPPLAVTAGKQTYEDAVTLKKNSTFTSANGTLTFKKAVTADDGSNKKDIEIQAGTGTVNFGEKTASPLPAVTVNKLTLTAGNVFSYAEISAQNAVLFTVNGSGNCVIRGPVKASSFKQAGSSCHLQIGASITDAGGSPLAAGTFNVESKQIYITHSATLDPSSTAWTRPADAAFFIAKSINLANSLSCANFVLFAGTVTMGGTEITAEAGSVKGDIVLFGSGYNADDVTTSDPSGKTGLFTYNHSGRRGMTAAPFVSLRSKLPDGTALPGGLSGGNYSGSFADLTGKKLKAGKNFYANGIELKAETGSNPSWTLDIPANDNATAAFAEAYFTTVKNCTVTGGAFVAAAEGCTVTNSSAWKKDRTIIEEAYTYSDDTIYVRFSEDIENSNGEILAAIRAGKIRFNNGRSSFAQVLAVDTSGGQKKPGSPLPAGDVKEFFLRTSGSSDRRWNTDATGTSAGSNQSTDRGGALPYAAASDKDPIHHQTKKPNLWIPKAVSSIYASLRDKHKNRLRHYAGAAADASGGNGKIYGNVEDRCPPVLAAVYIGQEQHVQGSSQPPYDAHNFIEFRYSEPVFIDGISDNSAIAVGAKYIQATDTLGNIETGPGGNITAVKGLASFSNGKLDTGQHSGTSGSVHAVYRTDGMKVITPPPQGRECRIRISVAGWVDGSGKWIGYINEALAPSVSADPVYTEPSSNPLNTANVRTRNPVPGSPLNAWEKLDAQFKPKIYTSPQSGTSAYGQAEVNGWDTSPPVFAVFAENQADWNNGNPNKEIVAYSASSQFAEKIEFHFFDNTPPQHTDSGYWWKTDTGWTTNGSDQLNTDQHDSYGGSRFKGGNRTTGGIRACTLPSSISAFNFTSISPEYQPELNKFRTPSAYSQQAENQAFFYIHPGSYPASDSLYLQLSAATAYPITEAFTVSYDASIGHITDLAGNKMKSSGTVSSTFGFPPNITLTVAPVGSKKMYILFTCPIRTDPETLRNIPKNLIIDPAAPGVLEIDPDVPAVVRTATKRATGIIVSLKQEVKYSDIKDVKRIKISNAALSPIAIKSLSGFSSTNGHVHALSDFAVNVVRPLFAYDEKKFDDGSSGFITEGLYGGTSQAVRLFDGSGVPGNTVLEKEDITLHLAVENVASPDLPQPGAFKMFIDNDPLPSSVSAAFNEVTGLNSRVWLPALSAFSPPLPTTPPSSSVLPVISKSGNNRCEVLASEPPGGHPQNLHIFKLLNNPLTVPLSSSFLNYPAGSRAGFLFPMIDAAGNYITRDHDNDGSTPDVPLYALRLEDPNDPASIDLWSLDISAIKKQAGGVSILNNVINVGSDEKSVITVTTEKAGSLSVIAMTLDGDVVKVLYSGHVEKGEHLYRWNGTNKNGEAVARGMYFIRVLGPGIDETRKVMAVKE